MFINIKIGKFINILLDMVKPHVPQRNGISCPTGRIKNKKHIQLILLVVENHERRVQSEREQDMGHDGDSHRNRGRETINLPAVRGVASQVNHNTNHGNHDHEHPLETAEDLGHLHEEVGIFLFLSGRSPVHVDAEHVRADRHTDVERKASEEDDEERHPSEVLEEGREQGFFTKAVAENGESDVGHGVEDNDERQENCNC